MAIHFEDISGDVAVIFLSYFNRAPEFEAMQHYAGLMQSLLDNPQTADEAFKLLSAQIYEDGVAHQEVPAGPTVSNTQYVNFLYQNVLGRAPDANGLQYWVDQLNEGVIERAELVGVFVGAALATDGRDALYLENRTEVAVAFSQWQNSNPLILPTLKYNAAEVLIGVNENPATVAEAMTRLETGSEPVGQVMYLTPEIDTLEGTTANDVFNAVYVGAGDEVRGTLTPFDSIDGDLGFDVMNIYVAGAGINSTLPETVSIRNVELVNVYDGGNAAGDPWADDYLLNVARYEGVQEFWQIDTAADVVEVGEDVIVGFRDLDDLPKLSVYLQDDVSQANVVLHNVGNLRDVEEFDDEIDDLFIAGLALDTVVLSGSLKEGAEVPWIGVGVGEGVRSVTVNSSVRSDFYFYVLEGTPASAFINNIDMSGSTGDLDFWADWSDVVSSGLTLTLGSGDDRVFFEGDRQLKLSDNIDGGEGHDMLVLEVSGKVQTQTYDAIARTKNFEEIGFFSNGNGGNPAIVDAAQLEGFNSLRLLWGDYYLESEGEDFVIENLGQNMILVVDGAKPTDTLHQVTLNRAAANIDVAVHDSLFELVVGSGNQLGQTGGLLTLWGSSTQDYSAGVTYDNSLGKFGVIDAGALKGNFYLEGTAAGLAETIWLGDEQVASVWFTMGANNTSTLKHTDAIWGFNPTDEVADMVYVSGGTARAKADLSDAASLQEALAEAAAMYAGEDPLESGTVLVFLYGEDIYLFGDTVNEGGGFYDDGDFLVKIAGVSDLDGVEARVMLPDLFG